MLLNYRVFIAGSQPQVVSALREMVQRLGCQMISETSDHQLDYSKALQADLVIMEGIPEFREAASRIREGHLVPVLFYSVDSISSGQSGESWGLKFTGKPEDDARWCSAMLIAIEKFQKRQDFFGTRAHMNSTATTRFLVAKAQEYLSREKGISEIRAIYIMQVLSQNRGITLRQMAERIVDIYRLKEETA